MDWTENVIIADADYVDSVAFNLTVNFERMIGRRIPPADMARWVECIALDGGMRPTDGGEERSTQVVLIHDSTRQRMENFAPGGYDDELDGKAVSGALGEFMFCCTTPADLTTKENLLMETIDIVCQVKEVHRIMIVADEKSLGSVQQQLRKHGEDRGDRHITLFTMQPLTRNSFRQEMLGYSLMAALGVKGSELNPDS